MQILAPVLAPVQALVFWIQPDDKVCHNRRINQHRVFQNLAARGKTSVDWFFGFKLHVVVNDRGELLNVVLTPGNTDDRIPVPKLLQMLFGKVFALLGLCLSKISKTITRECWDTTDHQTQT